MSLKARLRISIVAFGAAVVGDEVRDYVSERVVHASVDQDRRATRHCLPRHRLQAMIGNRTERVDILAQDPMSTLK
jgi:hypothetical protein